MDSGLSNKGKLRIYIIHFQDITRLILKIFFFINNNIIYYTETNIDTHFYLDLNIIYLENFIISISLTHFMLFLSERDRNTGTLSKVTSSNDGNHRD